MKYARKKPKIETSSAHALSSLVDLLEEKGILTQEEYEKRIKEKVKVR